MALFVHQLQEIDAFWPFGKALGTMLLANLALNQDAACYIPQHGQSPPSTPGTQT